MEPSRIISRAFLLLLSLAGTLLLPTQIQANTFAYAFAGQMPSGAHFVGKFVVDTSEFKAVANSCFSYNDGSIYDYGGPSSYVEVTVTGADGSSIKLQSVGVGEENFGAFTSVASCPPSSDSSSSRSGFEVITDNTLVNGAPSPRQWQWLCNRFLCSAVAD